MRRRNSRWVGGILLIVLGVIALLENAGLVDRHFIWGLLRDIVKWWPLILIFIGIRMLIGDTDRGRD
jgi:hypothetical protein